MAIALTCSNCGGMLERKENEDPKLFRFCPFCGFESIIPEMITPQKVKIDESIKTSNFIDLAFSEWNNGQIGEAKGHVIKALETDSSNARGWMLRSVIDNVLRKPNIISIRDGDLEFAKRLLTKNPEHVHILIEFFPENKELVEFKRNLIESEQNLDKLNNLRRSFIEEYAALMRNIEHEIDLAVFSEGDIYNERTRTVCGRGVIIPKEDLETGFEWFCDNKISILKKFLEKCDEMKSDEQLTTECNIYEKEIQKELIFFSSMKNEIRDSFTVTLARRSNAPRFKYPVHHINGKDEKIKLKRGVKEKYELIAGKHDFVEAGITTTLYIPKMPDASMMTIGKSEWVIGDDKYPIYVPRERGWYETNCFKLKSFPFYIKILF